LALGALRFDLSRHAGGSSILACLLRPGASELSSLLSSVGMGLMYRLLQ
jgi:hypothetical protein